MKRLLLLALIFFVTIVNAAPAPLPSEPVAKEKEKNAPVKDQGLKKSEGKASQPRVVTRVVGEVGDHTLTSREVQINDAVERAISDHSHQLLQILTLDDASFANEVTSVLFEWVVFLEAQSFAAGNPVRTDLQKTLSQVSENLLDKPAWKALEVSSSELRDLVNRKLVAKDFIRLKTDSSLVPVTDAETQIYYKKNRLKFGTQPFESLRDNIKAFLIKQQTDRRLKDWFEVLQRKYKVRNYLAG